MDVAVVGTGYVGLVTGTCLADTGNTVICVDIDKAKVEKMRKGIVPIYEPQLETLFTRNIQAGRLSFTTNLEQAVSQSEIVFLALPTPPGADGAADLTAVLKVSAEIGQMLNGYKVIVDKSTVPVGTAAQVHQAIGRSATGPYDVVSNPEFLREGFAVDDFMKPERVIIGASSERAREKMGMLYKPFVRQGNPILFMDAKSAELTKYASNAFLATKITFMNEIANFCELVGADVDQVRAGMGADTRIGKRFLFSGIGFGGSCFPKDVKALVRSGRQAGHSFEIIKSVLRINEVQRTILADKLLDFYGGNLKGKRFAMWGLSFKPNTDDIREASALYLIDRLIKEGAAVKAFDPEAVENVRASLGEKISYGIDQYDALTNADALLIMTEWSVFRTPDFGRMGQELKEKVIFDGRNLYDLSDMEGKGFYYNSIGRKVILPSKVN